MTKAELRSKIISELEIHASQYPQVNFDSGATREDIADMLATCLICYIRDLEPIEPATSWRTGRLCRRRLFTTGAYIVPCRVDGAYAWVVDGFEDDTFNEDGNICDPKMIMESYLDPTPDLDYTEYDP